MKRFLLIALLALLGAVSCMRMEQAGKAVGCCEMQINFRTGALQTKGGTGDGNVSDGGGIYIDNGVPDLFIRQCCRSLSGS